MPPGEMHIMPAVRALNLVLRFVLELALLVVFGYWGFTSGAAPVLRIVLAIGLPAFAAVVWGTFLAPASRRRLAMLLRLVAELILFGAAAAALVSRGQTPWAMALALTYALNRLLMLAWKQ